jgi:hypothetical protein
MLILTRRVGECLIIQIPIGDTDPPPSASCAPKASKSGWLSIRPGNCRWRVRSCWRNQQGRIKELLINSLLVIPAHAGIQ